MDKNAEKIFKILSIAVTTTGLMHILFSKERKSSSIQERTGQGNTNIKGSVNAEEKFKQFIINKKNQGLPYEKAKILEQIARIESRHFKSELLLRTNNIGAITSQKPDSTTLTLYVKPYYNKDGVFQGNIITDKYDPEAKAYHYRTYKSLQEGLEAFYNTVVANNYDFKRYSGDKNATLEGIKTPIVDKIYKS